MPQPTYSLTLRNTRWYVQWWEDGKKRRLSCGTADEGEARRFLAEFKANLAAEIIPATPTVGAILDGYLKDRTEAGVRSAKTGYNCATLTRHLGDLPIEFLKKQQVRKYMADRRAEGPQGASGPRRTKPLSDGSLVSELGTLRAALAWAVREEWITAAPYIERPSEPPGRVRWLSRDEGEKLLLAAALTPHIKVFTYLALFIGARAGAIKELRWPQIDFGTGTVDLGQGHGRKRRGVVPMTPQLRSALMEAKELATSDFVVEFAGGPVASIQTGFRAACRRAGLVGVTPHVLRHTAASWMIQRRVPIGDIARYLAMTEKLVRERYGHIDPDFLQAAAAALAA
jgi:integrase